jgi:hypothetical protein
VQPVICVNTNTSENHCGACWNRCNWNEKCIAGKCVKSCGDAEGAKLCEFTTASNVPVSVCANTKRDENHCGDCFKVCPRSQRCKDGACVCSDKGKTACPVGGTNGAVICVDTRNTNTACGGCPNSGGKVCPSNLSCRDSQCKCPRDRPNECVTSTGQTLCFNFNNDKSSCGACFKQCAANQRCRDGRCV